MALFIKCDMLLIFLSHSHIIELSQNYGWPKGDLLKKPSSCEDCGDELLHRLQGRILRTAANTGFNQFDELCICSCFLFSICKIEIYKSKALVVGERGPNI